jgi:hypothetical protein
MKTFLPWILFIAALIGQSGCTIQYSEKKQREPDAVRHSVNDFDPNTTFQVIIIDSCEYVVYAAYQKGGITHKGNCKNHPK